MRLGGEHHGLSRWVAGNRLPQFVLRSGIIDGVARRPGCLSSSLPSLMNSYRRARIYLLMSSCPSLRIYPSRIYPSLQIYLSVQIYPLTNCCRHALTIRQSRERKGLPMRLPKPSPFLRLSLELRGSHSAYSLGSPKQNRTRIRLLHNKVSLKVRTHRKVGKPTFIDMLTNSDLATISSAGADKVKRRKALHLRLISESLDDQLILKPGLDSAAEEFCFLQIVSKLFVF
jgi:hypothetical protein